MTAIYIYIYIKKTREEKTADYKCAVLNKMSKEDWILTEMKNRIHAEIQAHTRVRARTHTHTHTHTRARIHARTDIYIYIHTYMKSKFSRNF